MYIAAMETISLKEAAAIVGKDESTIRKYFSKPENKQYRVIIRNKVYVSKEELIKQYVGAYEPPKEQLGKSGNIPPTSGYSSDLPPTEKHAVDSAMQALISQLEAKDNQINDLLARLHESNSNHARALQQHNPRTDQEGSTQVVETLAAMVKEKDAEIAHLNTQLQTAGKQKSTKVDYTLITVILVLVGALITVMLIR